MALKHFNINLNIDNFFINDKINNICSLKGDAPASTAMVGTYFA